MLLRERHAVVRRSSWWWLVIPWICVLTQAGFYFSSSVEIACDVAPTRQHQFQQLTAKVEKPDHHALTNEEPVDDGSASAGWNPAGALPGHTALLCRKKERWLSASTPAWGLEMVWLAVTIAKYFTQLPWMIKSGLPDVRLNRLMPQLLLRDRTKNRQQQTPQYAKALAVLNQRLPGKRKIKQNQCGHLK